MELIEQIRNWCDNQKLSPQPRKVIETIFTSEPSRSVQGRKNNVCGSFPSRKMNLTIQFESHKVELPYLYMLEHDEQVLWFVDQPPQINLRYTNDSDKEISFWYTPDFFVIKKDSAGWVECKPEEELKRLSTKNPHRYCNEDESWRMPPGEKYAKQFGFFFTVFSDAEIDWTLQRNLTFLDDYYRYFK